MAPVRGSMAVAGREPLKADHALPIARQLPDRRCPEHAKADHDNIGVDARAHCLRPACMSAIIGHLDRGILTPRIRRPGRANRHARIGTALRQSDGSREPPVFREMKSDLMRGIFGAGRGNTQRHLVPRMREVRPCGLPDAGRPHRTRGADTGTHGA